MLIKKFFLSLSLFISVITSTHAMDLLDCWIININGVYSSESKGFNQNFILTGQMGKGYFACENMDNEKFYLRFRGISAGAGVSHYEGLKIAFIGIGSPVGTYYAARAQAAVLGGVNTLVGVGWGNIITAIGIDFLSIGIDPSGVRIDISKTSSFSEFNTGNKK